MQNEKDMFGNYSNLPARSPFRLRKDRLRDGWKTKEGIKAVSACVKVLSSLVSIVYFSLYYKYIHDHMVAIFSDRMSSKCNVPQKSVHDGDPI